MICPQCHRDNEAGATFCISCGARLERLCPNCQTPNVSDARFCKRCGQALMAATAATPARPGTSTGAGAQARGSSCSFTQGEPVGAPTWPRSFWPQHLTAPVASTAQV